MLSPRLTNCKGCADIPDLLRRIDCKLAELGNNLYNNVVFMLNKPIAVTDISQLLVYKRVLMFRYCDTHYATRCPEISTEDIASKVIRLTTGCVSLCNEPTVCEITTRAIKPSPNPTTTTTSTSSTSTTSTTSTSSTTTSTTTLNCNFTGVIDCSITTTTTTTPAPTTTTTSTYFPDPFGVPCLWSTNGGNPGNLAVYSFDTNTATTVLVPNDFNETVGIERPICATEDKLWLVSIVDQNPLDNDTSDKVYIREWDIDGTTPNAPTLTYVREITVNTGTYSGYNLGGTSVQAMAAKDNDTLIIGTGNEYGSIPAGTGGVGNMYALEFSIAASGDITVTGNDISAEWVAASGTNAGKMSNLTYTNSGQLVLGYRIDLNPDGSGLGNIVGNWLKVFPATPADPAFSINDTAIPWIKLQDNGYPEFTASYNGSKDAPFWGINGLAQLSHAETLAVYTLNQLPSYSLSLTTNVISSNDWLSSATHCSNIEFKINDTPDCGLTYLPALLDTEGNYLGPQTFEYFGMTCTASLSENLDAWYIGTTPSGFLGCSGLVKPSSEGVSVTRIVQGNNFSVTIDFPQLVNNIPIRAGVLNSNAGGTSGDVYYVSTNTGDPVLSINQGCYLQVDDNKLWGGVQNPNLPNENPIYNPGYGEVKVTTPSDFTSMTIYGNAPTGGPLFLGCRPLNCDNMVYVRFGGLTCSDPEEAGRCVAPPNVPVAQTSYQPIKVWNKTTGVITEVGPPPGEGFASGDIGMSNNIIVVSANFNYQNAAAPPTDQCFIKYTYDSVAEVPTNLEWDGVRYVLPPVWDQFNNGFIPNIEVINDNTIGLTVSTTSGGFNPLYDTRFLECTFPQTGTEMITVEKFALAGAGVNNAGNAGDLLITYKEDGVTPNKVIVLGTVDPYVDNNFITAHLAVQQYDYETGALEVTTRAEDFGVDPIGGAAIALFDGKLYVGGSRWATIDLESPYGWTELVPNAPGTPDPAGGASQIPGCRISNGFIIDPNVTTTTTTTDPNTTTTTTTVPPGVRTIFTRFGINNNPT